MPTKRRIVSSSSAWKLLPYPIASATAGSFPRAKQSRTLWQRQRKTIAGGLVGEGHTIIDWHGKVHATCRRWRCPTRMYARVGRIPTTKKDATTRRCYGGIACATRTRRPRPSSPGTVARSGIRSDVRSGTGQPRERDRPARREQGVYWRCADRARPDVDRGIGAPARFS